MGDLLDYNKALARIGGDADFLKELLSDLADQIDDNVEILEKSIHGEDYENLKTLAHGLKGVSANLNVDRLAGHFYQLEQLAANKTTEGGPDLLKSILQDRAELGQFINNFD